MKHISKSDVINIWEEYCKDHKPHLFTLVYNFFSIEQIQIIPDHYKEKILEQAKEQFENIRIARINLYFQTDMAAYEKFINKPINESDIQGQAKEIAVINYFEWLIKNEFDIFTPYKF